MANDNKLSPDVLREHKGISFVGISTPFFCYDGNGKFLMTKRSQNCRDEQGKWEIPAGGLKWGCTTGDNITREVQEELGATAQCISFMGYREAFRTLADGTPTHWLIMDFSVLVDPAEVSINEPDKMDALGWFTLDKQPAPLHSLHDMFMQKYSEQIKTLLKITN